jgi:conjugal transfer ATP-binding protein TraC
MKSINQLGEKIAQLAGDGNSYGAKPITSFKDFTKLVEHSPLEHILPYQAYDSARQLFLNDDSIGFGLELIPLSGADENQITRLVNIFNEKLPEDANLHIQLIASQKIGQRLDEYYETRSHFSESLTSLASRRVDYYKKGANTSLSKSIPLFIRDYKLFIYYSEPLSNSIEMQFDEINHLRETWVTALSSITSCQNLTVEHFISVVKEILNPSDEIKWSVSNYNELNRLSEQVINIDTAYDLNDASLAIESNNNNYTIQGYCVENFPDKTSL